jgi:dipeptidyl aminopeptidase/acylaminoacyl peptidase
MTTNDVFGRNLSTWLHEDAEHHVPDHLAEVLQRTAATRQRPAWSSLERWLPVDTTLRPRLVMLPRASRLVLVAALILIMAALAIIAVGSYRSRVPEPFGLARNGLIVTSRDGDIYLMNQATTDSRLIPGGEEDFDFSPIFSRDGTRMAFLRSDGPLPETGPAILTLHVADADGSNARAVTPPTNSLDWFDWSPDGTRIAYMARGGLYVVDVDEGQPRQVKDTGTMHFPTWLPPDGKEIVYRLESRANPGIYAIAADGTGERRLLSTTPSTNEFDYQAIAVSPDGSQVTFTRWSEAGLPRVFALDVATGKETAFPMSAGVGQRGTATYSPDGALVAYARIFREGGFQLVVANADGSGNERTIGPKKPGPPGGTETPASWAFTPDGTALMVRYGDDSDGTTHLMPLDGSPATELGSGEFEFVDIQRLAP